MLYLIESPGFLPDDKPFLKVGYTKNKSTWVKRLSAYNTHNPCFSILGVIENGSKDFETAIHRYLIRNSYRSDEVDMDRLNFESEWFEYDQRLVDVFNKLQDIENLVSNVEDEFSKDVSLFSCISRVDLFEVAFRLVYEYFDSTKEEVFDVLSKKERSSKSLEEFFNREAKEEHVYAMIKVDEASRDSCFSLTYLVRLTDSLVLVAPLKEVEFRVFSLLFP